MFKFLPKFFKTIFLVSLFLHFVSSSISARVLVQDGVKLPLVAESNVITSEFKGRILVNAASEEPPSALEIIRSREKESSSSGGFENFLNNPSSTSTATFSNPVPLPDLNLTREEIDGIFESSLNKFALRPVTFSETLKVLGATSLATTTISGPLTQDGTLMITGGRNIDVVGDALHLQSEGLGGIDFIAGKMKLDLEGNLMINGQLSVEGGIKTNFISPLASNAVTVGQNLKVEGGIETGGLSVLGKTTLSDLSVSGAVNLQSFAASSYGRIKDLILDQGLIISDQGEAPSVGTATIYAGTQKIVVPNTRVTEKSRIFLSIDTSSYHLPPTTYHLPLLSVSQKLPGSYFVVATDQLIEKDLTFNWLMIN